MDEVVPINRDVARAAILAETNVRLRRVILDLLEAPYLGGPAPAIARTNACYLSEHPRIRGEQDQPCYCGKVKGSA